MIRQLEKRMKTVVVLLEQQASGAELEVNKSVPQTILSNQ